MPTLALRRVAKAAGRIDAGPALRQPPRLGTAPKYSSIRMFEAIQSGRHYVQVASA